MDDQQLYGGTQSALSTTLLLWIRSSGDAAHLPGELVNLPTLPPIRLPSRRANSEAPLRFWPRLMVDESETPAALRSDHGSPVSA
jgi:hypothetical protein